MRFVYLIIQHIKLYTQKTIANNKNKKLIERSSTLTDDRLHMLHSYINRIKHFEISLRSRPDFSIPENLIKTINLYRYLLIESSDFSIAYHHLLQATPSKSIKDRWSENFYIRILCTLSYEFLNDAIEVTGSKTNKLIESYSLNEANKNRISVDIKEIRIKLQLIYKRHNIFLKEVRNNTMAHKNHESYITIDYIERLDFQKSVEVFNEISHCQSLLIQFCGNLISMESE
ncbi:hypothetical protein SAMN04487998_1249 [Hymenobacter actinosclerus]|uniref:Cthe-2314-like HEPN domain-containing protein n=1 Tax=Hymenobacter actinosclerus TaxID=82805 RepID=A0A1I0BYV2_9BACT|nr:hypothetical protein SAMN04487998_1249 [Hymenobacter actinosclerus]